MMMMVIMVMPLQVSFLLNVSKFHPKKKKVSEIDTRRESIFIYLCFVFKRKQMSPFIDLSLFKIIESYRARVNSTKKNNSNHYRYFISLYLKKLYGYKQSPPKNID